MYNNIEKEHPSILKREQLGLQLAWRSLHHFVVGFEHARASGLQCGRLTLPQHVARAHPPSQTSSPCSLGAICA